MGISADNFGMQSTRGHQGSEIYNEQMAALEREGFHQQELDSTVDVGPYSTSDNYQGGGD